MKKSRFNETQIVKALKEHESGRSTEDICYSGMESNELKRLKELEEESLKLYMLILLLIGNRRKQ